MADLEDPPISQDDIDAFRRDGVVCLRGVFSQDWRDLIARGIKREMAAPGPIARDYTPEGGTGRFFGSLVMWRRVPEFEDFVRHGPAAAIAAAAMGSDTAIFYHDQLLVKEPGTEEVTPWHHDQPYYPVDGEQVASIWLPLDPVARDSAPEFVAGSHRWGRWFAPRYFKDGTTYYAPAADGLAPTPDIDAHRADYRILGWAVEPGDGLLFHGLTLHGAPGNASAVHRRRAYATRWLGDDAHYAERPGEISPPIDGHGLAPGDAMACAMFPVIWRRAEEGGSA